MTINQVRAGLDILARHCDGDQCNVALLAAELIAGPPLEDVPDDASQELINLGWHAGEFGWEIFA